jgi:hypothetical protein
MCLGCQPESCLLVLGLQLEVKFAVSLKISPHYSRWLEFQD